jgi:hypothetical protein
MVTLSGFKWNRHRKWAFGDTMIMPSGTARRDMPVGFKRDQHSVNWRRIMPSGTARRVTPSGFKKGSTSVMGH